MRLRFAPSPTGALHIGGARTALYNWLLARHSGGTLLLRIEDTDRERSTEENIAQILDALDWLELDWDEGPLMQTSRTARHREVLDLLLESGAAYRSTATAEDVKAFKATHGAARGFRGTDQGEGAVRLRVPDEGATVVDDVIRGQTTFEHVHLDDPVIARADGSVLYNFAVAVDDLDAGITHVVRGEDHLSNTPKQLLVLEAARRLGAGPAEAPLPRYAHLPLLHGPDGKKLSKRHGAASVQELRTEGFLPAAVRNYLALLGWGASDDATVLSTEDLVAQFSLERVSRNPARFDVAKLTWLTGVHIRALPPAALAGHLRAYLAREEPAALAAAGDDDLRFERAVEISQEKIHTLAGFWPLCSFLFGGAGEPEESVRERWLGEAGREALGEAREALLAAPAQISEGDVERALERVLASGPRKPRDLYQPLRVAISGTTVSPGIFESVALLGREETVRRIDAALEAHSARTS
ncbi:MAG: glutamate--tRNA ligase [Acidobacteriota bacterium]|nr:glutamate--tRNA ligase [Acidobacteriota bacterium]